MKSVIKRLAVFAFCAAFSILFCLSASAADANEYGLGLTVSCEEADGNATVNISLKNSNSFDVDGIGISAQTAEDVHDQKIGTLKAGESFDTAVSFKPLVEQAVVEIPQPEAVQKEESHAGKVIAAAAIAIAITAVVLILLKKNKKAAALMLAVTILIPFAGMFSVHAIGTDEARSFTLETTITVGGKDYPLSVKVNYTASTAKNSYFEFETAPEEAKKDGQTVTRLTTDFSGTATANESVKTVTYEIRSEIDNYESPVTGEADLSGCEWSAERLALKPGKNEITFTAELENGETQTQTYELTYDRGELYEYKPEEVKEENGTKYVKNVINIYFDTNTTDERIAEILAEQKLAQIGEINDIRMVQTRTLAADFDTLNAQCDEIEGYSEVLLACLEEIVELESNAIPNDSWDIYNENYKEDWNENMPGGYNWHLEAIQAPSAWDYDKYFNSVAVGVIDGGFKTDHEDYNDLIKFTSNTYKNGNDPTSLHGTHVAGIIGAAANNSKGITGILWDVDIYGAVYTTGGSNTITNIVNIVAAQVASGAKAVNLSLGLSNAYDASTNPNPYLKPFTDSELASSAKPCAVGMNSLINQGKEFVVVQSAGNGVIDTRLGISTYRSADAYQNGLYCSILENGSYGSLTAAQVKAVYDRIIVVGAVRNRSNNSNGLRMNMYERSNGGDRVDIYAPGVTVYSTIADHYENGQYFQYAGMTGTSQAAPIVTAVAGLCFAINPNLTGAQVKSIIRDEANTAYTAHDYSLTTTLDDGTVLDYHPFEEDGRVINMKLCAEAALRTVCGKASYTYLNRVVAAAQSLDPNAYTNYYLVQEVIDSIDYNLYEFEQDKVSAKANELIAAMDKLDEKDPADYSSVTEAVNRASALNPDHYVDFSGVTAAVNAVVYGKYADEQEAVNKMAQDILDAINSLELICKIESSDSEVVPDNSKQIIVISPERIETMLNCLDAGAYSISFSTNKNGVYSTGSTVILSDGDDSTSDIVYTVTAVGDVNGDGAADAEDAMLVNLCISGDIEMPDEKLFPAYDANCDGSITAEDVELLEQVGLYNDVIINLYEAEAAA
ncbi:MAG: S8 family serine peptidase [Clostridia bacterium]|nr:S8 family serine peptidase [Clostridia bacterium]